MKTLISWNQIDKYTDQLCEQISDYCTENNYELEDLNGIYGIPRGGIIVAVMMSHKLQLPYIDRLQTMYGKRFIVLDDIADSGKTLQQMKAEVFDNALFATIHYNSESVVEPHFWIKEKLTDWIIYPWERVNAKPIQDYKLEQKSQ